MNYDEAIECEVSAREAKDEIRRHSGDADEAARKWAEFIAEQGERDVYAGADVLAFLGY